MPITPERISRLREFGLSEYAARAYLALLDLGLTEARDVSNLSRVPQAKVYQVLDQLHDKGLAIILPEFPKKYAPVPFEEFIDRIHKQHMEAADSIDRMRDELTTLFSVMGNVDVGDRGDFTIVRGRRNVLEKLDEVVSSTTQDLLLIGTNGLRGRVSFLRELAARARRAGAGVRYLLALEPARLDDIAALSEHATVRARDPGNGSASDNVAIVIADSARALLIHFVPDDGDLTNGRDIAVFTDQEAIVGALQVLAGPLWEHAPTLESLRENRKAEGEFNRVYATQAEVLNALHDALRRGAREVLSLHPQVNDSPLDARSPLHEALRNPGTSVRVVAADADLDALTRLARTLPESMRCEVRQDDEPRVSRCTILDEREAFLALAPGQGAAGGDLVLHTNNPVAVRSLRAQFEAVWPRAKPLLSTGGEPEADASPGVGKPAKSIVVRDESQDPAAAASAAAAASKGSGAGEG